MADTSVWVAVGEIRALRSEVIGVALRQVSARESPALWEVVLALRGGSELHQEYRAGHMAEAITDYESVLRQLGVAEGGEEEALSELPGVSDATSVRVAAKSGRRYTRPELALEGEEVG